MKPFILVLVFMTLSLSNKAQLSEIPKQIIPLEYGYVVEIGQQLPDFEFQLTDGSTVSTEDLKGKVVMLQFTASWCGVCRQEMPHIEEKIWLKHKNNNNFRLYGLDLDEPLDLVKTFKETIKITYPLALDPEGKIFYTFAAEGAGVTRNVIIDKNGKIVYMTRLFNEDEFKEMVDVIDLLLGRS